MILSLSVGTATGCLLSMSSSKCCTRARVHSGTRRAAPCAVAPCPTGCSRCSTSLASQICVHECLLPWYGRTDEFIYIEPDVMPTLETLRDRGLKLGLVSNTSWPAPAHDRDL